MPVHTYCLATVTTAKAIDSLKENADAGGYRDAHPWIVGRELWMQARDAGLRMPLLLAVQNGNRIGFSHYAWLTEIAVLSRQLGGHESVCRFEGLKPMHPIWEAIDSVTLQPTPAQVRREELEGLHQFRFHLTPQLLRPYAICETPAFLMAESIAS
ncbi:MAG: hypothetical protein R3E84_15135 [Pseudomonadales bacterium]